MSAALAVANFCTFAKPPLSAHRVLMHRSKWLGYAVMSSAQEPASPAGLQVRLSKVNAVWLADHSQAKEMAV
jgi:hypothetical protein